MKVKVIYLTERQQHQALRFGGTSMKLLSQALYLKKLEKRAFPVL